MRLDRLRNGEWLSFSGGLLLLIAMFLPWFHSPIADGRSATAWEIFSVTDVLLALLALGGIALAALVAARSTPAAPVAANVLLTVYGAIVVLVLLYRLLLNQPDIDQILDLRYGAYIGLALALAVLAGRLAGAGRRVGPRHAGRAAARPAGAGALKPGDPPR